METGVKLRTEITFCGACLIMILSTCLSTLDTAFAKGVLPNTPVCVLGESIGSGPACALARETIAPDKIVLVVPFDSLASVASKQFFFLPVRLLLRDAWDNVEPLRHYTGPIEIFGATDDRIIPIEHAEALAKRIPSAHFIAIGGAHNDWSEDDKVKIRR